MDKGEQEKNMEKDKRLRNNRIKKQQEINLESKETEGKEHGMGEKQVNGKKRAKSRGQENTSK